MAPIVHKFTAKRRLGIPQSGSANRQGSTMVCLTPQVSVPRLLWRVLRGYRSMSMLGRSWRGGAHSGPRDGWLSRRAVPPYCRNRPVDTRPSLRLRVPLNGSTAERFPPQVRPRENRHGHGYTSGMATYKRNQQLIEEWNRIDAAIKMLSGANISTKKAQCEKRNSLSAAAHK